MNANEIITTHQAQKNSDYVIMNLNDFQNAVSNTAIQIMSTLFPNPNQLQLDNYIDSYPLSGKETNMALRQRVLMNYDETGNPVYRRIQAKTKKDLNDRIVQAYIDNGRIHDFILEPIEKPKTLFKPYVENWLEIYKKPNLKPKTFSTYLGYLHTHLYPSFGDCYIEDISVEDVQLFMNKLKTQARKSIKNYVALLKQILDSAVEDKLIETNPAKSKRLTNPSNISTPREALKHDVLKDIVSTLQKMDSCREKLFISLLLFTGIRKNEALGLRWDDIDFEKKEMTIQRGVTHIGNKAHIGTPKTKSSNRIICLGENLLCLLLNMRSQGFVFGGEKPLSKKQYDTLMRHTKAAINLHGATPHYFRHTFLTLAGAQNIDSKTIQSLAGHADYQITMNHYVHPQNENIRNACEVLDTYIADFASKNE